MDSTEGGLTVEIIVISMAIIFIFALVVILFFVVYQRRLLKQENIQREKELVYQKELLEASIQGQEQERLRIAKDLHDDVGTMLTTAKVYFEQFSTKDDADSRSKLSVKMKELLGGTIQSVREISHDLRPVILERLGLDEAIQSLVATLNESAETELKYTKHGSLELTKDQEIHLYRIIQELITNSMKHAQPKQITILLLAEGDTLFLNYSDDGIGIDIDEVNSKKGIGLKNIESRLSLISGEINYLNSTPGFHAEIKMSL